MEKEKPKKQKWKQNFKNKANTKEEEVEKEETEIIFPSAPPEGYNPIMAGPTDWTFWVIKNRLLAGAHPRKTSLLVDILKQDITIFVCLMPQEELDRQGKLYFDVAKSLIAASPTEYKQKYEELEFIHIPIMDRSIASDEIVLNLVQDLIDKLTKEKKIFLHCRGGHGRTGTIVSILLGHIYKLRGHDAIKLCQSYHDCRRDISEKYGIGSYSAPDTPEQKNQVYRLLDGTREEY